MGWFLQWGNWAVAKVIEVLFNTSYLSDVGCTFRVISRDLVPDLLRDARVDGSSFGLEMLMLAVVRRDHHRAGPGELPPTGRYVSGDRGHPDSDPARAADVADGAGDAGPPTQARRPRCQHGHIGTASQPLTGLPAGYCAIGSATQSLPVRIGDRHDQSIRLSRQWWT